MIRQIDNTSAGGGGGGGGGQEGNLSLAVTKDANLDTQSLDISAEEIRQSGRSSQSLIVCGKKRKVDRTCILMSNENTSLLGWA